MDSEQKKKLILCEWKDAKGAMCGMEYRFTIPIPGQYPLKAPSLGGIQWWRLCEGHYEYERPLDWHDELLQQHKEKLETIHGAFSDHIGKDMAAHCLGILKGKGGIAAKFAKELEMGIKNGH